MKAEIRDISSPDVFDIEEYQPKDKNNFSIYLELSIGRKSQEGEDLFGVTVCTPKWLLENYNNEDVLFLKNHVIVFEYDYYRIINSLQKKVESLSGKTWEELLLKLSKIYYWEFEDYNE